MSKGIHWKIPFQSTKGVDYEIRIYDSFTGTIPSDWPIILQGGEHPITTSENDNDDFFIPARPSSATIQVIDPDGTLMAQLVPSNNIERPVRLIKVSGSVVEWQGFLSCEAYSQDYTAVAQTLELNAISILEAMDSVHMDRSRAQFCSIRQCIANVLEYMTGQIDSSFNIYSHILWSRSSADIMSKYIDTSVLFDEKEVNNEEYTEYLAYSISCKEMLTNIATFMGWTIREQGAKLYFQRLTNELSMYSMPYQGFVSGSNVPSIAQLHQLNMSDMIWRGTAHEICITQGARIMGVDASVDKYELNLEMPGYPYGDAVDSYINVGDQTNPKRYYLAAETMDINNKVTLANRMAYVDNNTAEFASLFGHFSDLYGYSWPCTTSDHEYASEEERTNFMKRVGAYMCKTEALEAGELYDKPNTALYLVGIGNRYSIYGSLNYTLDDVYSHIFEMHTVKQFFANNGWLRIYAKGEALSILDKEYLPQLNVPVVGVAFSLMVTLKYGDKYWNKSSGQWQSAFCAFEMPFTSGEVTTNYSEGMRTESTDGYFVPITSNEFGCVELRIHAVMVGGTGMQPVRMTTYEEACLSKLEVTYEQSENLRETDRSTNHYSKILDVNFSDEVTISTNFATKLNNLPSPSLLMDDNGEEYIEELTYIKTGVTTEKRRPERDLLDRMCKYYGRSRRKIMVEIEHPTESALPLLTVNGYDTRKYCPLSEERDWQSDTCRLNCYEQPAANE